MDGRIGVLELPGSWCLPRLAEVNSSHHQRETTAELFPTLSASNSTHSLPDLRRRQLPPSPPLRKFELGASLVQIAQAEPAIQTDGPFTVPAIVLTPTQGPDPERARLPVYTSPVPPPSDEHPFEPHIRRFEDYHGEWISDSEYEALTPEQLDACETRFEREQGQVKRNASLFTAVTPAHGHKVLAQHARLLNQMQEI